jgi:DNA-binding sugar fermentation-stimulating protein
MSKIHDDFASIDPSFTLKETVTRLMARNKRFSAQSQQEMDRIWRAHVKNHHAVKGLPRNDN